MTVHGLRPEFQPSNFAENTKSTQTKAPQEVKTTSGEHEGIPSVNAKASEVTGLGQSLDIQA